MRQPEEGVSVEGEATGTTSGSAAAFLDYYRCAERFARLDVAGELLPEEGYFRFGAGTAFGRLSGAWVVPDPSGSMHDVTNLAVQEGSVTLLPFDLAEVVENLRCERYPHAGRPGADVNRDRWRSLYYLARPLLPVPVRKHLQRARLRGWDRLPFPGWPVDDSVGAIMEQCMALLLKSTGLERIPFVWFWPDGATSAVMMTHDVEEQEGLDFCDRLMDLDDSFGIKASFQLIPEVRYRLPRGMVDRIRKRGFEVNVHDLSHDGRLFQDRDEFRRRAARINEHVRRLGAHGFRSGAMYREQAWYEDFDFSYDMSVPNVAHLEPQRGGCCTVLPYFNGQILELPLTTIQDYSLFHILGDYTTAIWKRQSEILTARHGLISFITHPDYLMPDAAQVTYRELLDHIHQLAERGAWVALPGEIDRWWRSRCRMTVVEEDGRWRVEGPEGHRARVAFARLGASGVFYEMAPGDGRNA